jgi:hypothetical protein
LLIGLLILDTTCFADPVEAYRVSVDDKTGHTTTAMVCVKINFETTISYEKNS